MERTYSYSAEPTWGAGSCKCLPKNRPYELIIDNLQSRWTFCRPTNSVKELKDSKAVCSVFASVPKKCVIFQELIGSLYPKD